MRNVKKILLIVLFISLIFSDNEGSKYYYIDSIDEIKNLELVANKYLSFGDTLSAINTLIKITENAEISDIYSDDFISDYLYKIGNLFLLIQDVENAEKYLLLSIERCATTWCPNKLKSIQSLDSRPKVQPRILQYHLLASFKSFTGNAK